MKDTQNITLTTDSLINNGLIIQFQDILDAYVFSQSIIETINHILKLPDVIDIPSEDIYTMIRSQIKILQSIDLT